MQPKGGGLEVGSQRAQSKANCFDLGTLFCELALVADSGLPKPIGPI